MVARRPADPCELYTGLAFFPLSSTQAPLQPPHVQRLTTTIR